LGNIKIGVHEQTRLQPDIVAALDAPLRVGLGGLLSDGVVARAGRLLPNLVAGLVRAQLAGAERLVAERFTAVWRRLVTRSMMTLKLPYGEVRLGADVPRLPSEEMFPDMLRELEHPELVRIIRRYDNQAHSLAGSR